MVPASITQAVSDLATSVTAAAPLESASKLLISALQVQGDTVLAAIDAGLSSAGDALDASDPTGYPGSFPLDLDALCQASSDQSTLSDMRGLVGRALFNLAQVTA